MKSDLGEDGIIRFLRGESARETRLSLFWVRAVRAELMPHSYQPHPGVRLLLMSSSAVHGTGYLDHAESEIRDHLADLRQILFVPYALADRDGYAARAEERFARMGFECISVHRARDPKPAVAQAPAIFIGGGNTFRLLKTLQELDLLKLIRERVLAGMPYMGASAGSNVAAPTIRTTNDMPIVEPQNLRALGVFPCQINPHYLDPDPGSTHMGETREVRLLEYLEENETPVIGLREGAMLRVRDGEVHLRGIKGARIFARGMAPYEVAPGTQLDMTNLASPRQ
jgi:dipeptidase E